MSQLLRKARETGEVAQRKEAGRPRKTDDTADEQLVDYVKDHPFATASEGRHILYQTRSINVSDDTVRRWWKGGPGHQVLQTCELSHHQ